MTIQITSNNPEADKAAMAAAAAKPAEKPAEPAAASGAAAEGTPEPGEGETAPAPAENTAASGAAEAEEEDEQPEGEETPGTTQDGKQPPNKKKGGFQRRIDKLNARNATTEQERDYWREQALKNARPAGADPKPDAPGANGGKPADTAGKPKAEDFQTHAEFVEAMADYKADQKLEQKLRERDQKAEKTKAETAQQTAAREYAERAKAFAEKKPDFQEVLTEVNDIPVSVALHDILVSSENGPELAYELAKDPEEFARVNKLPPLAVAREIGKLESRLTKAAPASASKEPQITKAPAPIKPVGSSAGVAAGAMSLEQAANTSHADFVRVREQQLKKRRQA